ncbi:MAG: T9SS type A sorting domain-containing protein, partial [Candidatus Eiseniibacteriota bacterium]
DGAYTSWSFGYDPVTQALRGLGVRADRYRFLQGYDLASNIGGHELAGGRIGHLSNYFPNYTEYPIADSLASWYRIMIQSSHIRTFTVLDEQDAALVEQWWDRDTGSNQGDRCIFASGDNVFDMLFGPGSVTFQTSLAQNVFGVFAATSQWSGTTTTPYPTIDDRFAASSAGPALAAANTFTYPLDGGCGAYNGFDALTKVGTADAFSAVFYPNSQIAGIARMSENDGVADKDRSKAIGYAYSLQFIRDPAYAQTNANYTRSGVENRMRVLYKFLTSCRGPRTGAPADTGKCWPCPSPGTTLALMQADWAGQSSGFATGTWGSLYPIQAGALATAVEEPTPPPVYVNSLLQNRPNPFNPETAIPYSLATGGRVAIRVFDISGRRVRTLVDRVEPVGPHVVRWNGKSEEGLRVASGVYFYRITYPNGETSAKKLMIVR